MDLPDEIQADIEKARALHARAASDFSKCVEFNKLMSDLLTRLEDGGYSKPAGRVMSILLDCNPKEGSSCDKSSRVEDRVRKL